MAINCCAEPAEVSAIQRIITAQRFVVKNVQQPALGGLREGLARLVVQQSPLGRSYMVPLGTYLGQHAIRGYFKLFQRSKVGPTS